MAAAPAPPVSRSEARNAAVREQLEPLAPGERPLSVTIGAAFTALVAVANVIAYAAGDTVNGKRPSAAVIFVFSALMLGLTAGLWRARYWAVLTLEAVLGLLLLIVSLVGLLAEDLKSAAIAVGVLVAAGTLFWFLIKAMARLQMPR